MPNNQYDINAEIAAIRDASSLDMLARGLGHATVPTPNIPGTDGTAFMVKTVTAPKNAYEIGALVPITDSITEGDIILIAVLARTATGGTADGTSKLGIRIQTNEAPYSGFGENTLALGTNWIKTQAKSSIAAGKSVLAPQFRAAAQAIEVGQVYVINTSLSVSNSQ
jgi:hypothetical protein